MRALGLSYVMVEPLANRRLAETLAREVGLEVLSLDPLPSLTDKGRRLGDDYLVVMDKNLEALRVALRCE